MVFFIQDKRGAVDILNLDRILLIPWPPILISARTVVSEPLKIFPMIGLMGLNPAGVDDLASSANVVSYRNQPDIRLLFRIRLHCHVQD